MILLFAILLFICAWGVRFSSFHEDYLDIDTTTSVKGIFAAIILFSHITGYIQLNDNWFDMSYRTILGYIGQLMVVMYFFYSGYGIFESFKSKMNYEKSFTRKRLMKTLIHFDAAVLLFLILSIVSGEKYPTRYYFTCWIGWDSIGNSNWFIFVILALYACVSLSMVLTRKSSSG